MEFPSQVLTHFLCILLNNLLKIGCQTLLFSKKKRHLAQQETVAPPEADLETEI